MSFCRKFIFLFFCLLFLLQVNNAQNGWAVNRSKGSGDLVAVFFTSDEKGWIAGDSGYLAFTIDGGKSWIKQEIGTKENINEIYFRNDDNGYLVAGKKMFITRDGGRNWQETQIYKASDFKNVTPEFLSIRFADKKRGVVVGSLLNRKEEVVDSLVMRTEDGGETWQRVFVPSKGELYHLDFVGNSRCWIVGDNGLILASFNGGSSFQLQKSGTDKDLYNVDFRDESEGYAVGGKGTILRTENGGETWEIVKTNFPNTFLRVNFTDDKNGWIVGYGGTILRSSDRGKNWIKQESGTNQNLYGLYMVKKYGWSVGASGVVINYQR
ncbi:MAG TPA: YCF48-related protein [Pyrinomonadaceae bacterium]|jgi:photosystem II stability/assembly factor-like uncharacterized protein